jgi:acyl-CoA dehydrogenase
MNELRSILSDSIARLFDEQVTVDLMNAAESGSWSTTLWKVLEENGHTHVLVPENDGGVGGNFGDALVVIRAAGQAGAPVPLVETIVAGHVLSAAGVAMPGGPVTLAPMRGTDRLTLDRDGTDWRLTGTAPRVPWGRDALHAVAIAWAGDVPHLVLVPRPDPAAITLGANVAREPRDRLAFDGAPVSDAVAIEDAGVLWRLGAWARSGQIAGALTRVLDQSVEYATERVQFGRPISKLQIIQQQLAILAGHAAAAGAAAEAAAAALDRGDGGFEVAVAKVRASEVAAEAASIAHQTHGAIGFTYEHSLHYATRRLWSWRAEFGTDSHWAEEIGRHAIAAGGQALWPYVTGRGQ